METRWNYSSWRSWIGLSIKSALSHPHAIYGQIVVAGGNKKRNRNDQLNLPTKVIIDKENDSLIISDFGNRRVVRWPRQNGHSGEILISNIHCRDLIMDNDVYLYVSDENKHEVRRWKIGEKEGTIVVSGNGQGKQPNQFNSLVDLSFDRENNLYVVEWENNRVQRFDINLNESG